MEIGRSDESRARQEPRRRSMAGRLYGKVDVIPWREPSSFGDQRRNEAARFQHAFAFAIRRAIQMRETSVKGYAAEQGIPYEHLARMLRGAAPLTIETIADADLNLGGVYEAGFRLLQTTASTKE